MYGQLEFLVQEPAPEKGGELPDGAVFTPDFVSTQYERELLDSIDSSTWDSTLARRVQHYGWSYDYKQRRVDSANYLGPLPSFLNPLVDQLQSRFDFLPDQAIINEYLPGQGIAPHVDCKPCFGPTIAMLGLGSDVAMDFSRGDEKSTLRFERRGLLLVEGDARREWAHGIAKRRSDPAFSISRSRRVSITLRKVINP